MIEILKSIIFGIIEGITEWLPISSTGHMILLNEFIKLKVSDNFYEMFEVVIQLGAILAVLIIFFKILIPWGFKKTQEETKNTINLWLKIIVACLPAAIIGLLFDDLIDKYFFNSIVVSIALIVYGIIFLFIEKKTSKKDKTKSLDNITYKQALKVGIFQVLALIPGTSRSGSTIIGGLLVGLDKKVASEFTFILSIPIMFGASFLKILKYVLKVGLSFSKIELLVLIVGCTTAFIVSLFVINFLLNYIKKKDFKIFGYYRIILGLIIILYFLFK